MINSIVIKEPCYSCQHKFDSCYLHYHINDKFKIQIFNTISIILRLYIVTDRYDSVVLQFQNCCWLLFVPSICQLKYLFQYKSAQTASLKQLNRTKPIPPIQLLRGDCLTNRNANDLATNSVISIFGPITNEQMSYYFSCFFEIDLVFNHL